MEMNKAEVESDIQATRQEIGSLLREAYNLHNDEVNKMKEKLDQAEAFSKQIEDANKKLQEELSLKQRENDTLQEECKLLHSKISYFSSRLLEGCRSCGKMPPDSKQLFVLYCHDDDDEEKKEEIEKYQNLLKNFDKFRQNAEVGTDKNKTVLPQNIPIVNTVYKEIDDDMSCVSDVRPGSDRNKFRQNKAVKRNQSTYIEEPLSKRRRKKYSPNVSSESSEHKAVQVELEKGTMAENEPEFLQTKSPVHIFVPETQKFDLSSEDQDADNLHESYQADDGFVVPETVPMNEFSDSGVNIVYESSAKPLKHEKSKKQKDKPILSNATVLDKKTDTSLCEPANGKGTRSKINGLDNDNTSEEEIELVTVTEKKYKKKVRQPLRSQMFLRGIDASENVAHEKTVNEKISTVSELNELFLNASNLNVSCDASNVSKKEKYVKKPSNITHEDKRTKDPESPIFTHSPVPTIKETPSDLKSPSLFEEDLLEKTVYNRQVKSRRSLDFVSGTPEIHKNVTGLARKNRDNVWKNVCQSETPKKEKSATSSPSPSVLSGQIGNDEKRKNTIDGLSESPVTRGNKPIEISRKNIKTRKITRGNVGSPDSNNKNEKMSPLSLVSPIPKLKERSKKKLRQTTLSQALCFQVSKVDKKKKGNSKANIISLDSSHNIDPLMTSTPYVAPQQLAIKEISQEFTKPLHQENGRSEKNIQACSEDSIESQQRKNATKSKKTSKFSPLKTSPIQNEITLSELNGSVDPNFHFSEYDQTLKEPSVPVGDTDYLNGESGADSMPTSTCRSAVFVHRNVPVPTREDSEENTLVENTVESKVSQKSQQKENLLDDSFDGLPRKQRGPEYAHVAVVRKKKDREQLNSYACHECEQYFGSLKLPEAERQERMKNCRHKAKHAPVSTPPGFWNPNFPDSQECQEYMNITQAKPSAFRRRRRYEKKFDAKKEETHKKNLKQSKYMDDDDNNDDDNLMLE